ncbi:MAG: UvrD-helicase domain-containing protein, partial [Candidatus Eremiobacteraeota bacterium]|nr:UvrD-helicase domain-containing protein [Candidatus Eremiobacteraeota bacterium]
MLVLAGAGSGKTRVLTCRIAKLVKNEGISPGNIVAVTFTNKAAREMKERIRHITGRSDFPYISTFHSLCARILRNHLETLGYPGGFAIYDERDSTALIKDILKEYKLEESRYPPKMLKGMFSLAKIKLEKNPFDGDQTLQKIFSLYENLLKKNRALDFDDLLKKTVEMFYNFPDILKTYRERFHYILVDEFQDVNYSQYILLRLLSRPRNNLFVVGDDDQSIYGFRGADVSFILSFKKDFPDAKVIKMEQNFRSTGPILKVANSLVTRNTGRMRKKLWCTVNEGDPVFLYRAVDAREEARFVISTIKELRTEGFTPDQCAILFRINAQSRAFEEACIQQGLNYHTVGGVRFFDRAEIRDLLAILKLLINPFDRACFRRAAVFALRGIGPKRLEMIYDLSENFGGNLINTLSSEKLLSELGEKTCETCKKFYLIMENLRIDMGRMRPHEFIKHVLEKTGYLEKLEDEKTAEAISRLENLEELISQAREFEEANPGSDLEEYLNEVSLYTDVDTYDFIDSAVTMMTLHSAKGLEFPVIFLTGMEEGLLPHIKSLASPGSIEEERRLC